MRLNLICGCSQPATHRLYALSRKQASGNYDIVTGTRYMGDGGVRLSTLTSSALANDRCWNDRFTAGTYAASSQAAWPTTWQRCC